MSRMAEWRTIWFSSVLCTVFLHQRWDMSMYWDKLVLPLSKPGSFLNIWWKENLLFSDRSGWIRIGKYQRRGRKGASLVRTSCWLTPKLTRLGQCRESKLNNSSDFPLFQTSVRFDTNFIKHNIYSFSNLHAFSLSSGWATKFPSLWSPAPQIPTLYGPSC